MKTLLLISAAAVLAACGSTYDVQRIDPDAEIDLTGEWNERDARMVSEDMIQDVSGSAWMRNYTNDPNRENPILIVGRVRNETMEHIDTEIITRSLERELINSGNIGFVADPETREHVREERLDQQSHTDPETTAQLASETGADYMLFGNINAEYDETESGDMQTVFYNVNLELINLESNEIVWLGQKQIRKLVERSSVRM